MPNASAAFAGAGAAFFLSGLYLTLYPMLATLFFPALRGMFGLPTAPMPEGVYAVTSPPVGPLSLLGGVCLVLSWLLRKKTP